MYDFNDDSLLNDSIILIKAVEIPENNIPSIRIVIISLTLREINNNKNKTAKAPINEDIIIIESIIKGLKDNPKNPNPIIINAAPRQAPELTPSTYGPARGFLKIVCMCSPLIDRAVPTIIAVIALGIRSLSIMILEFSSGKTPLEIEFNKSLNEISKGPVRMSVKNNPKAMKLIIKNR